MVNGPNPRTFDSHADKERYESLSRLVGPGDVVIDNPYFTNIAVANVVSGNILTMTGNTSGTPVPNALLTFVKKPGQTIVATLREGRSTAGLQTAGVGTAANSVDSTPTTPPPQATLLPSVISEREAQSQVIY